MKQWVRCQVVMGKGMCNGILSCSWMFPNRLASYSVALSSRVIFLLWFEDGGKKERLPETDFSPFSSTLVNSCLKWMR